MTTMTLALADNIACDLDGHTRGSRVQTATEIEDLNRVLAVAKDQSHTRFPLTPHQAEDLMDRDGIVTVTVLLDQEKFFSHLIASASGEDITPEGYAHDVAFGFGAPCEASARVMAVSGSEFLVSYSTYVREYLED